MGAIEPLVLASASPRRKELLERIGIPLRILPADIDETPNQSEDPKTYVARIAAEKGKSIALKHPAKWVLAADTSVSKGQAILGKPRNRENALVMLASLSGSQHLVSTAVVLCRNESIFAMQALTKVRMRKLPEWEIEAYLDSEEWRGKAGGYAIQGLAAAFVESIEGSVSNVIGLPLAEVIALLAAHTKFCPSYPRERSH